MDDINTENQCLYLSGKVAGYSYSRLASQEDIYKKGFSDGFYIKQVTKKGVKMLRIFKEKCLKIQLVK